AQQFGSNTSACAPCEVRTPARRQTPSGGARNVYSPQCGSYGPMSKTLGAGIARIGASASLSGDELAVPEEGASVCVGCVARLVMMAAGPSPTSNSRGADAQARERHRSVAEQSVCPAAR